MRGMNSVPAKSNSDAGQYGPKHIAAGFSNTAPMASWVAATPTPPIEREVGPMPISWSPLVARTGDAESVVSARVVRVLRDVFIGFWFSGLRIGRLDQVKMIWAPAESS